MMKKINDISIGVDMEDVDRFQNLHLQKNKTFLHKVFTEQELKYCYNKKKYAQSLAARYAAKEAVFKALGDEKKGGLEYCDVELINNKDNNFPHITINNKLFDKYIVKISLSHTSNTAIAFVILYK